MKGYVYSKVSTGCVYILKIFKPETLSFCNEHRLPLGFQTLSFWKHCLIEWASSPQTRLCLFVMNKTDMTQASCLYQTVMSKSINRTHNQAFFLIDKRNSFHYISSSFVRERVLHKFWFDNQPLVVLSFVLEDHFILGDVLSRTRSTTARAINCLKEIVSNIRLDQFLIFANRFHFIALQFCSSILVMFS